MFARIICSAPDNRQHGALLWMALDQLAVSEDLLLAWLAGVASHVGPDLAKSGVREWVLPKVG